VSAAAYLELAGTSDVEPDLKVQKAAVSRAQKEAIPFYPEIEAGRRRMASLWLERNRFRSRDLEACRHEQYNF
jgi:hypothetical protein